MALPRVRRSKGRKPLLVASAHANSVIVQNLDWYPWEGQEVEKHIPPSDRYPCHRMSLGLQCFLSHMSDETFRMRTVYAEQSILSSVNTGILPRVQFIFCSEARMGLYNRTPTVPHCKKMNCTHLPLFPWLSPFLGLYLPLNAFEMFLFMRKNDGCVAKRKLIQIRCYCKMRK